MLARISRTAQLESKITATAQSVDTMRLATHLQTLAITAVEIDAEVAELKRDIIRAAQKHHLKLNGDESLPNSAVGSSQHRETVIKFIEKPQHDIAVRVS